MAKDIETVLRNFIRHVTNLKAEDDPAGTGIHREFRMLREAQIQNKNENRFSMEDGRKDENIKKNRYKDILPRDDRRVKLTPIPGVKGSDYINATFLEDVRKEYGYIAAQGPMPDTVIDFWRMIWEYNTEIVFMACRTKEDGRAKCEKYWADLGKSATYGDITMYTDSEDEVQDHFIRRQLRAVKNGETHQVTQYHYTGWPDHNIPSSPDALRKMIEEVRNYRKKPKIPMVVHCSAGCGRTGTICAIDYAWTLLDEGLIEDGFSMFEIIKSMREQRMSMVQTPDQYEYTHMVLKSLCNEWLTSFADHDYVNVTLKSASKPEAPEEDYCNFTFPADDSSSSKEASKPVKNAKGAAANNKPDIKHLKPALKPPTSEVVKMKKQTSAPPTNPPVPPKNFHMEGAEVDAGEYIEVRQTATISGKDSACTPPSLPHKKNLPPNTAPLDPVKTVITLPGGSASPHIVSSGSKQKAPKPPQVTKGSAGLVGSSSGPQLLQHVSDGDVYSEVVKSASVPSRDQSAAKCTTESSSTSAKGAVPELPQRNYKPEEVCPTTTTTISSNNVSSTVSTAASKDARMPSYDNIIVTTPSQHQQQQTRASPRMEPTRVPQAIPKAQAQAQAQAQAAVTRSGQRHHGQGGNHPPSPVHPVYSGQQDRPYGMVSAMGGGGGHQVAPVRHRGDVSYFRNQQARLPASSDHRQGPVVMKAQSAGVIKGHTQPVSAPQPGQIIIANKGKRVFLTEHPQRVHGPRPLPQGWTTFSKNHRGTFL